MKDPAPLVCLITPGHVASTPRLVKNADALVEAGYRVHVVAGRHYPPADPLDSEILQTARWSYSAVDCRGGPRALAAKLARRIARQILARRPHAGVGIAARAHHASISRLAAEAARIPAQLYFGHCLAGLPIAALAARRRGTPYGFDAEDFHDAETEEASADPAEAAARRILQSRLIPGCGIFTAASPLISRRYGTDYGRAATTLLNVFPLSQAPERPSDPGPATPGRPARCYWFSQTVGPGRGLEQAVSALARMQTPVELCLRGFAAPDYEAGLQARAAEAGLGRPIRFLKPGPPSEMARLAAGADLGLSTEESVPLNRDLCLTNKVFVYLLAGVPQLLSDTSAQAAIAPDLGSAAILGSLKDPDGIARSLDRFFSDPNRVAEARRRAWTLARERYCWDRERAVILGEVGRLLPL
jgi:glycosyltransferase involved in cell wall biosynthesis